MPKYCQFKPAVSKSINLIQKLQTRHLLQTSPLSKTRPQKAQTLRPIKRLRRTSIRSKSTSVPHPPSLKRSLRNRCAQQDENAIEIQQEISINAQPEQQSLNH